VNKEISNEFIWATIVAVLGVLIFRLIRKNKKKVMIILLGFLMLFDLIGSDIQMIEFRSLENVFTPKNKTTQLLSESGELFRVYSPSYSIPQEIAAIERIQLLDGIDPMQLRQTVDYMEAAAGIPMDQYSVTMPPFKTGNPDVIIRIILPDARLLWKNECEVCGFRIPHPFERVKFNKFFWYFIRLSKSILPSKNLSYE
jgi:hypothetical protein